jgi:hypothetical protein
MTDAPMGTWFNANYYRDRPITITPYPENVFSGTVPGLAFNVSNLLGPVNPADPWQLFSVSDVPRGYRQVKYAIARQNDDCCHWLSQHLEPVPLNQDDFVELYVDDLGEYRWRAQDAEHRIMISVFVANTDDAIGIPVAGCRTYQIRKIHARQVQSPGHLVRHGTL